jgi:hypothetical protein
MSSKHGRGAPQRTKLGTQIIGEYRSNAAEAGPKRTGGFSAGGAGKRTLIGGRRECLFSTRCGHSGGTAWMLDAVHGGHDVASPRVPDRHAGRRSFGGKPGGLACHVEPSRYAFCDSGNAAVRNATFSAERAGRLLFMRCYRHLGDYSAHPFRFTGASSPQMLPQVDANSPRSERRLFSVVSPHRSLASSRAHLECPLSTHADVPRTDHGEAQVCRAGAKVRAD